MFYITLLLLFAFRLQQCEEDKQTKDSQIRSLKEELVSQEELVSKLQKEKKAWADGRQQKEEELQSAEDKANHLTKIKMKLEQNLDELEDSVEREKKVLIYIPMLNHFWDKENFVGRSSNLMLYFCKCVFLCM